MSVLICVTEVQSRVKLTQQKPMADSADWGRTNRDGYAYFQVGQAAPGLWLICQRTANVFTLSSVC